SATTARSVPRSTRTRGPPPWSGVTTRSSLPSPVKSPAATDTPPVKVDSNGSNEAISPAVRPSNTRTSGGSPGPDPAITSANPSPFTSPSATRTPPKNCCGSNARKSNRTAPVGSYTRTRGSNPASAPTATSRSGAAGVSGATGRTPGGATAVTTGRASDAEANPADCTYRSALTAEPTANDPPSDEAITVTDRTRVRGSDWTSRPSTNTSTAPPDCSTRTASGVPSLPTG